MSEHGLQVLRLYRNALLTARHWAVDRAVWRQEAVALRARFDAHKHEHDRARAALLLAQGEAELASSTHPDPYRPPTALEGSKWERNTPPSHETCHATAEEEAWLNDKRFWR
eukprot:m.107086 g.107086  ORF g.107086 m.107086 type:complete len:112 (-) comp51692_c0_seq1:149-484(-)